MTYKKNSFVKGKSGKPKSAVYYVDNQKFYEACLEHYNKVQAAKEQNKPNPQISNYIGECLMKIAQKMTESSHFRGYDFKEDMIGDAIENMVMYFNNFDIKYKNPFSYFSQICYFAFLRRIGKERDRIYNQYKLSKNAKFVNNDSIHNIYDDEDNDQFIPYDQEDTVAMQTFVEKYEEAVRKRKEKKE